MTPDIRQTIEPQTMATGAGGGVSAWLRWPLGVLVAIVGIGAIAITAAGWGTPPAPTVTRTPVTMVAVPDGCDVVEETGDITAPRLPREILTIRTISAGPIRRVCDTQNGVALYVWQGVQQTVAKRQKERTDPR